jgi:hypothetical protein
MEPGSKQEYLSSYLTKQISNQKISQKRQRSLHIDKENNPSRGNNICEHMHSEHWCIQFHKTNTAGDLGGGRARCQNGSVLYFFSVNEKSQVTKERVYSEERKRGRTLGITKEMLGQQKSTEKQRQQRKATNISKPHSWPPRGRE